MKTIQAVLEWTKEGYGVWIDEFPNVFSFGKTIEEAKINARSAIEFAFEDESEKPTWLSGGFEIDVKLDTAGLNRTPCFSPLFPVTPR